jgi:HDOD domain-containing protein
MPDADSHPRSLSAWLEFLGPFQPPVDLQARDAALKLLADGGVARQLAVDPALVLLLFRAANQALARYDREAHTLDHAIGLLGAARVQALLEQAPVLAPDHPHAVAYRQVLMRSRHAAQQALLWAEGTGLWPAEEVFWSTLIAAAPLWPLWLEVGSTCEQLEQLRARQGAVSARQTVELLGCTTFELGAAVAELWLLPEMSQHSWQRKTTGSLRQWVGLEHAAHIDEPPVFASKALHELCHRPALVVAVANALAEEADWDWQSRRCLRLMSIATTACRRPLATILSNCHQTAAVLSREYVDSGLLTPATKLLGAWRQAWFWAPPAAVAATTTAKVAATVDTATPLQAPAQQASPQPVQNSAVNAILSEALQRLRTPGAIDGVRAAFEITIDALQRGLGFKRAAVLLLRGGSGELQTVLSGGAEKAPALRQFRYPSRNNQLLTQLLSKPLCLRLSTDNHAKFWMHLPEEFRAAIDCDKFLLMGVFTGARASALLYADNTAAGEAPDDRQYQLFKQLCQQLSSCLTRLAEKP